MPKPAADDWQICDTAKPLAASALFDMTGRTCLVSGGGSGIGSMIASGYVANGGKVYIVSRKDCSALAEELTKRGPGTCVALRADVGSEADIKKLKGEIEQLEPNGLHVLVNNAGTNWAEPFEKYSVQGWDKTYDVNVRGVFLMSQAFVASLTTGANNSGQRSSILNISSIESISTPGHDTFAYSTGKAAVSHLTKVLAGKFGTAGTPINVNAILPGPFQSRMMRTLIKNMGDAINRTTAVGRIGSPQDMAGCALFLSSRAGAFSTGSLVVLDGGQTVLPHMGLAPRGKL